MSNERYERAADWAEDEMALPSNSKTALRGADAAQHGRGVLERALGGRPSIDPQLRAGRQARVRQVRVAEVTDQRLKAIAKKQKRNVSAVMRDAVDEYLSTHS